VGLKIFFYDGIRRKKFTAQNWRPIVKILESPIYFEGRMYTSVMVQCFGTGFIYEMVDNTPHNKNKRRRTVVKALKSVQEPNVVLKTGKPVTPKKVVCICSQNDRYEFPEALPAKVSGGDKRFFLPSTLLKSFAFDTTPKDAKTKPNSVSFKDYVNSRK
jgi:hypothetical protein